jgi:uncharacterized oxidoreductase
MQVTGKKVVVTGGTDGIGLQLSRQLRDRGATVIVVGRDPDRLAAATANGFHVIGADLSSRDGCDALLAELGSVTIDVLVNNAGAGTTYLVDGEMDRDGLDRSIFLNLNAPMHLIAGLLPGLRERPCATIVNVTSGLAYAPRAGSPVYCATKAGLRSFTQSLRHQLRDSRITVIEALPPVVETRMTRDNPHKKMAAEDCAAAILAAIETDREEAAIGATKMLRVVSNIAPALARRVMIDY